MSHSTIANKNKQQKHPKVQTDQYLYNAGEPKDRFSHYSPLDVNYELLEDSHWMRRNLRRNAQRLRNRYG